MAVKKKIYHFYLFMFLLSFTSCKTEVKLETWQSDSFRSVENDLTAYGLPLKVNFPVADDTLGDYKTQIASELDGFVWKIRKGDNFKLLIEDIGSDTHIFDQRIQEMLTFELMQKALISQSDSIFIFKYKELENPISYYIIRRLVTNNGCFIISTNNRGVPQKNYYKMLQTILSVRTKTLEINHY